MYFNQSGKQCGSTVFSKEDEYRFSRTEVENTFCLGRMWSCTSLAVLNRKATLQSKEGAQWLSGRVLDSRPRGRGVEPHLRCVLEQGKLILA